MCPPGYRFIRKPRKEEHVGFMYKSTFEVHKDDKVVGDYETMEHLLVEVEGDVTWCIATVYRPPPLSKNGLTDWQFLRAVPEIILGGGAHFFLDPSTPRTNMQSEPPDPQDT